eukprot:Opistho-1_new@22637
MELRIAIGMAGPLQCLAIDLETVTQAPQQSRHRVMRNAMAQFLETLRKIAQTLGRPPQWRHRIPPGHRFHQRLQIVEQGGVRDRQRLAATTRATHPPARRGIHDGAAYLLQTTTDRAARNPGYARNAMDSA